MFIVIPFTLFCICFFLGKFFSYIIGEKERGGVIQKIVYGYLFGVGLFHIISLPFMFFHLSFNFLFYLYITIIIGIIIISIIFAFRTKNKKKINFKIILSKKEVFLWSIIILIILLQIILVVFFQHTDADDSFYISQINTTLGRDKIYDCDPSTGLEKFPFHNIYQLVSYEILLAAICKFFQVNAAMLAHSIIPIFLIPLHYIIVYKIAQLISKKFTFYYLMIFCVLNIFSGYSVYLQSNFLLFRIWQGKAVLVNIILPLLLYEFCVIAIKEKITYKNLIILFGILIGGMHTTTVGLYLIPISYGMYTLIYSIIQKSYIDFLKLCLPIIGILPNVLLKAFVLFTDMDINTMAVGVEYLSYYQVLKDFNGKSLYLIIFAFSIFYIILKGNKKMKFILGWYSIGILLTVLNPLIKTFVASKITGTGVYWRLLWLLQINFVITMAMVLIIKRQKRVKLQIGSFILICIILIISGKFIFNQNNFTKKDNWYKIDNNTIEIANAILKDKGKENKNLLIPQELSYGVRQYTPEINLIWSRYIKLNYDMINKMEEFNLLYEKLYCKLYGEDKQSIEEWKEELIDLLKYYNVDYVVLLNDSLSNITSSQLKMVYENNEYLLFRVEY